MSHNVEDNEKGRQGEYPNEIETQTYSDTNTAIDSESLGRNGGYGESNANAVDVNGNRELTNLSRKMTTEGKVEEGSPDVFDLTDFLQGISQDRDSAGLKNKRLGLIWKNLTVKGKGADASTIKTIISPFESLFEFWKWGRKNKSERIILNDQTGFVKDGEMLLVLGRPGAGCTSLLRVLSGMRAAFTEIDGDVFYGDMESKEFNKHYRGEVCYNSEEDMNYPTLSTRQTLEFALRNKTPGKRLPEQSRGDFINKTIYLLGNMLGLTKQMDTVVGNAFVRGLSGGERKRLSIAEQMTTRSTINCWDCSTRGLDASSALDYVRSLRIITNIFHNTTVASLYQASDSIFNLFDKLLVLDEGRVIYFGPTTDAKAYFEDMGYFCPDRKSTPDFLTGLCNPLEREIKPGFEDKVPLDCYGFEQRYKESDIHQNMMKQLAQYEEEVSASKPSISFKDAMKEEHQRHTRLKSPYTSSFYQQVKALTIRQYQLVLGDPFALYTRYGTMIFQGLIMASCFYMLPLTGTGAFSRGGGLFFCALFNTLASQSQLVAYMMGRPVLEKHKQFALYHPSAFYIAQVILDIPLGIIQVIIFQLCVYFMMGLDLDAGKYFTFMVTIFFLNLTMNGFFRFCGAVSPNFFVATQLAGMALICVFTYTGYQIQYSHMHPWLSWIYWIDPVTYAFKVLISNEMQGQSYSCEGSSSVPYGPSYTDQAYKACLVQGGSPGATSVSGDAYLWKVYSYGTWQLWAPDFVALVGFFLLFTLACCAVMEWGNVTKGRPLTKVYAKGKAPVPKTEEELETTRTLLTTQTRPIEEEVEAVAVADGTTFSWQHINYTVPVKGGKLQLLNDISGIVKPGHLTALMGSSGAGKTTLLDVLAKRKTIGDVEGRQYMNGETLGVDFERVTGYCEQMDVHQPASTVREALRFSAYLRQPADVPRAEKDAYVDQIIDLLEMKDIADAQIGEVESGFGISVEERKRLTIGVELVGKPKLLFLDEPTSGLDAQSSFNIIRFIRKLADSGWPVLCTIHQPSATLFEHFDHLLLLVRGGRTAYYGEIGQDARTMINYFESNGGPKCSPQANPAEYILEVVGAGTAGKVTANWADIWAESPQAQALTDELEQIHQNMDPNHKRHATRYAQSFPVQFRLVFERMSIAYWRSPDYNLGRLINVMFTSLLTGFTFWKLGASAADLQNRLFALFGTFIMANTLIILAQPKFMTERQWFRREYASKYYGWAPFALSSIFVEVPYIIVLGALFMSGFYWTAGLKNTAEACGFFYIFLVVFVFWAVSFGFLIAAVSESPTVASIVNPVFITFLILFAGLVQSPSAMPKFYSSWVYWLDPFHYYIEGLTVNELDGFQVHCSESDLYLFNPPAGQTCGQYTQQFLTNAPGYIDNPNDTSNCGYCPYKEGNDYFNTLGWSASNKWRNFGIIVAFWIFNIAAFLVLVYWKRKGRR
ncbi:hypothetical protein INT43_007983 [Umbelopsis isabellina]|uniref:ABC transporter domain-containing protein n=1 Tax=Mortierella isabellina TaxID=91625 RepID=A0A8H7PNS1_MORIS|nr:hypothetical protein INT43_007983 [Umbelopsis isabellina]